MKRIAYGLLIALMLMASTVLAVKPNGPAAVNGLEHPGVASQLYLYQKCPSGGPNCPWDDSSLWGAAWGKMTFDDSSFVFNGHGLVAGTGYSLIYYPDPRLGVGCKVLGTSMANGGGNVNVAGSFDFSSIPVSGDTNSPKSKIWLVLSDDVVDCDYGMNGWNPTSYLFESALI